jgi:hypothetical protein
MLSLALSLPVPAAMAQPVGEGGGGGPAAVAIAGTPAFTGTSGAHSSVNVTTYNHPGGTNQALAVVVSGRPATGGEQAVSATWNGVAVPERVDSSDGGAMTANESFVWIGLLPAAATGVNTLAVTLDKSQSDSVVGIVSLENVDQAAPVVGVASAFDETTSGVVATAGRSGASTANLFLAGAGIALGSYLDEITAGWTDLGVYKSDAGTSTSTCALVVAHRAPTSPGPDALSVTWGDSTTRARALGLVEVKAAA